MKKNLFLAALAFVALASCTSDEFVGGNTSPTTSNTTDGAISFNSGTPAITRAEHGDAAALLNNNFVVYGYKTVDGETPTYSTVFDNYQVNWVTSTAGTTESNSADWEYVSYKNLPVGVSTNVGVTDFSALTGSGQANETAVDQSIKYWDFSASAYDFFAYSLGTGSSSTWAIASALNKTGYGDESAHPGYTLTGTQAQLGTCYISKKNHVSPLSSSSTQVNLQFINFLSKIQLKFYETIPGYSVKDVKFYIADGTKSTGDAATDGKKPSIYGASSSIPTGGTYTITFDSNNDPVVTLTTASSSDSKVEFDPVTPATTGESPTPAVWLSSYAARDYKETEENVYLGRTANAATSTKQMSVLPNSTGTPLTLKMDYTLLSRDGSGETITVTGAEATVPADFTKWKPNYAYTYIFKISDNTNGQISGVTGLYPITFDAIVTETVDGTQTTITTVATPSITTYQNGAIANEYIADNIYVTVGDGSTTLTVGTNANLYTATIEAGAAQGLDGSGNVAITEEMVANALTKTPDGSGNYVLTDANGKNLTVTLVASNAADKLVAQTSIPAADAPGGKELDINCAYFAAVTNTVYVFEFIKSRENATGTYVAGTKYYTAGIGGSEVDTSSFVAGETSVSSYYVGDPTKHYKVIKVGTPVASSR